MISRKMMGGQSSESVALKDERLVYRACSLGFAQSVGKRSPDEIIGRTDFDLFPGALAREQMALDSQAMFSGEPDISALELQVPGTSGNTARSAQAMIVRTPVISKDQQVRGIDIRLLSIPGLSAPKSAVTIDYQTLVNDGIQGSMIISLQSILFANDNAARVLGYQSAQALIDNAQVSDIFSVEERDRAVDKAVTHLSSTADPTRDRVALAAHSIDGSKVRLIARVTHVQWGASRALLLSFVDVALSDELGNPYAETQVAGSKNNRLTRSDTSIKHIADASIRHINDLRRSRNNERRFRDYASAGADFFWETDAKLTIRAVSEELSSILGIPREKILGQTVFQLLKLPGNTNDDSHWKDHLQQLADGLPFRDFEFRWCADSEARVIRYSGIPVFNESRKFIGYRGVGCDITAAVQQAETTAYHANHDALTGLFNRRSFENTLSDALEASRASRETHAFCFMDLDSFKIVNDICGHQAGDELLRQLTQLFDSLVRKSDVLARLGGDEFGILFYKCSVAEALKLANQIRHEVENFQFLWNENRFTIGVSVGLVVVDDRWDSIKSLFNAADSACYIAKDEGRNRVVVYREGEGNASNRKVATHWVEEINAALEEGRMRLACQKILPLQNQTEGHRFEMYLRLEKLNGELVSPHAFLPTAERYGLTSVLDQRAIALALAWLSSNPARLDCIRHVSLNLSASSCTDPEFATQLVKTISNSSVDPSQLCFEVSETTAIANLARVSDFMHEVSALGCRFGIDDFGSGLSSFAFLRKLPVDFLKIDGLLVKNILEDSTDYTVVKAISEISRSMGKLTIAEFVESASLLEAVQEIGIDFGQGYHLGEPELIH